MFLFLSPDSIFCFVSIYYILIFCLFYYIKCVILARIIRNLIIYFISSIPPPPREIILPFFFVKATATTWEYVVTRNQTRPHSCLRMRSNCPQTLMKLTLYHSDKRIFRRRARPCVGSKLNQSHEFDCIHKKWYTD